MVKWILCLLCFSCINVEAQAQDVVQFENDTWEAVKEKAQIENKLIFIDGYTTWCEPCKMMDIQVFNTSPVANFFNQHFVNYKMNMEAGIGPIFSVNYSVMEFPTFLFVTPDGTLVHKIRGYKHADELLSSSEPALDPETKRLALDARYEGGGRKPDFLYNYTFSRLERMDGSHREIVKEFLQAEKDWSTKKNVQYIYQFMEDIDSEMFTYMAKNRKLFEDYIGKEEVSRTIDIMVNNKIFNSSPPPSLEEISSLYEMAYQDRGKLMALEYKLKAFKESGDLKKYFDVAIEYYNHDPLEDEAAFRTLIKTFYDQATDPAHISTAYNWSKQLNKKSPGVENQYQVALFEYKLKDKKSAKKSIKSALKMAKKSNYGKKSELETLAKKIKKL